MIVGLLVLAVVFAALAVGIASGFVRVGSRVSPVPVAAVPEAPRGRLAELVEDVGITRAEVASLRREWGDFNRSWEKRWGTVTRGMRKDDAASAAAVQETPAPTGEDNQLEFSVPGQVPLAEARRPMRPVRFARQG